MKDKVLHSITIFCFTALISVFSVWNALAPKETVSWNENRTLAKAPSLEPAHLFGGKFDDDFESWFSDHFMYRDFWIELKAMVRRASLFIENNDIYFAEDERLISRYGSTSTETLQANIDLIHEFSEEHGIRANILIVPGAVSSAKDTLPQGACDIDQAKMIEDIAAEFADQNFIPLDRENTLTAENYFRTDHHWNESGSYLGYRAICEHVLHKEPENFTKEPAAEGFVGTMYSKSGAFWTRGETIYTILPEKTFSAHLSFDDREPMDSIYSTSRLQEKDKYTYYIDGNHPLTKITTNVNSGRKALILKDSFSHILMPYLAAEYDEITLIDLRYYHQPVSDLLEGTTDFYVIYSLDNFADDPSIAFLR